MTGNRQPFEHSAVDDAGRVTRRDFLRVLGAGAAVAGLGACVEPPRERILPYTARPPEITPGIATFYATTMILGGFGTGLVVKSREGRPTKVEGNPHHPASLGAAGVFEQASVLELYDPDRVRIPRPREGVGGWDAFARDFALLPASGGTEQGRGLHFLMEPTASPLTNSLIERMRTLHPAVGFTFYSPLAFTGAMEGARHAFGRPLQPVYDLSRAAIIVSLDADVLDADPFCLRYARQFADGRRLRSRRDAMNRLYVAESAFSTTGGMADHRLPLRAGDVADLAKALLAATATPEEIRPAMPLLSQPTPDGPMASWVRAAAADLRAARGQSVIIAGAQQPAVVHAIANALNAILGNIGTTVRFIEPLLPTESPEHALATLAAAIDAGAVDKLVILGGNPSGTAPADLRFGERIRSVRSSAYLGLHHNETALDCKWVLPALHYLESWGDARAYDGTASFVQPLIRPLYDGRSVDEVLAVCGGWPTTNAHALVRELWSTQPDFTVLWARSLERGVIENTASPPVSAALDWAGVLPVLAAEHQRAARDSIEVTFRLDPKVLDGRFANNPWLQELPHPITKLTWGNAAQLGPDTAKRLGIETGDEVSIAFGGGRISIPAIVVPGHAEMSITLPLGYGRSGEERTARDVGVNVYPLRTRNAPYILSDARVRGVKPGSREPLAITQGHFTMQGRMIAREATLAAYRADPRTIAPAHEPAPSLYKPAVKSGEQWAMTIDLSVCTGCSACVIACQAENNIPVVGREGVLKRREMHWLRVDRYYTGAAGTARVISQPMACQHCEKAPCEYVCPVNATVHSPDGLNEMVYNRCVGTRFCSNNCPYKVRRFNWFDYGSGIPEVLWMQRNPDVTVRERGVMEKCTYCVQRIRRAGIQAATERRALRDGEVVTACQQACPTRAITFGSLDDPESEVSRSRRQERSYEVLGELGTEPRTRYLARIFNPSPDLTV